MNVQRWNGTLMGVIAGMIVTWACAPSSVPSAQAQDANGCAQWQVIAVVNQVDVDEESGLGGEGLRSLGHPEPFADTIQLGGVDVAMPQTVEEAAFTLPPGLEPFAENDGVILTRRCAS